MVEVMPKAIGLPCPELPQPPPRGRLAAGARLQLTPLAAGLQQPLASVLADSAGGMWLVRCRHTDELVHNTAWSDTGSEPPPPPPTHTHKMSS